MFILKKKKKKHSNIYFLQSLSKVAKYEHVQSFSDFLTHEYPLLSIQFHRLERGGEARCRRHDVRAAACRDPASSPCPSPRLPPCLPPWSPERHTLSGRQPKGQSSPHIFSASTTIPSILPVWWILFSALLSWVIWGIIPKVSTRCKPAGAASSGRFSFFFFFWFFVAAALWSYTIDPAVRRLLTLILKNHMWCFFCCAFYFLFFCKCRNACFFFTNTGKVCICYITSRLVQSAKQKSSHAYRV